MSSAPQTVGSDDRSAEAEQGPRGRKNKSMIAGYFSRDFSRAVKLLAAERGVTVQALVGEGLDHVLREAGKSPLGER